MGRNKEAKTNGIDEVAVTASDLAVDNPVKGKARQVRACVAKREFHHFFCYR